MRRVGRWLFLAVAAFSTLLPSGARSEEIPLSLCLTPCSGILTLGPPSYSPPTLGPLPIDPLPDPGAGPLTLRLVWFDIHEAVPFAYAAVATEVRALFRDLGISVAWRRAEAETITSADETQVILLATRLPGEAGARRTMGATRKSSGSRAVWVFLRNVAWALGLGESPDQWPPQCRADVSMAVARVIAHELIHAVIPEQPHAKSGLMADSLGRLTLLQPGLRPDPQTQRAFRAAVAHRQRPTPDQSAEIATGVAAQR